MPSIRFSSMIVCVLLTCLGCAASADHHSANADNEDGFAPLFDGETLAGWKIVGGDGEYKIEDGEIVGICDKTKNNTFLRTEQTFSDFEFRCEFKWDQTSNSGIQYRSHQRANDDGEEVGRVYGYQFELDPSNRAWSGGLFEEGRRKWLYNLKGDEKKDKREAINLDGWNQIVIRCEGRRLQTWLNGVQIVDYTDEADEALMDGFIALQVHSGDSGQMRWRNLRLKDLSGS